MASTLIRTLVYASVFVGVVLVFLPARVLSWSGVTPVTDLGVRHYIGMVLVSVGSALALWCVGTFIVMGRGTPAPFDPPRRLVVRGPYRIVRNPMYVGAGLALAGASLYYMSIPLLCYLGSLWLITHLFVTKYEEPTLRRTFGSQYDEYCQRVGRWMPKAKTLKSSTGNEP